MSNKIDLIFFEKINHRFKRVSGTRQASGLTNCLNHLVKCVAGTVRCEVDNIDHVHYAIQKYRPKKIVFEALWLNESMIQSIRKSYPNIGIYVHMHSKIDFLSTEGHGFHFMNEYLNNKITIIWNDKSAYDSMYGHVDSIYLPNTYSLRSSELFDQVASKDSLTINAACYGALRPMKNHLNQAIAAIRAADWLNRKLIFHVNLGRSEGGDTVKASLKGLFMMNKKHELISMPWMEEKEFIQHLRGMDIGLQVSLSETFNMVAADYVCAGIPIVVSEQVHWADPECKANPHDTTEIAHKITNQLRLPSTTKNRSRLIGETLHAAHLWSEFVKA